MTKPLFACSPYSNTTSNTPALDMETISYVLRKNADKVGFYRVSRVDKGLDHKYHELVVIMESRPHEVTYIVDEDWEAVYDEIKEFVQRSVDLGMYAKATIMSDVYGLRKFGNHDVYVPGSEDDIEYAHSSEEEDDA